MRATPIFKTLTTCHRHSNYVIRNEFTHEFYLGGESVALKPLNENQQYKKQVEICSGYVSFSLYGQSEKWCNHKSDQSFVIVLAPVQLC